MHHASLLPTIVGTSSREAVIHYRKERCVEDSSEWLIAYPSRMITECEWHRPPLPTGDNRKTLPEEAFVEILSRGT